MLQRHGDLDNARHGRLLRVRRALAGGEVRLAEQRLAEIDTRGASPALHALTALAAAEIALRQLRSRAARTALDRALHAARKAGIGALVSEIEAARAALAKPVARLVSGGAESLLRIADVETLMAGRRLIVDACRRSVSVGARSVSFRTRPVLFALLRCLAEAASGEVSRGELLRAGFGMVRENPSLRARLRVAIGRLRRTLRGLAELRATPLGFRLHTPHAPHCVIAPPVDGPAASLLAWLSDGEAWSTSALALGLGLSQRSVQRALAELERVGEVRSTGGGRSKRWLALPLSPFAPHMLLLGGSQRARFDGSMGA